jgi:hypothetical protein
MAAFAYGNLRVDSTKTDTLVIANNAASSLNVGPITSTNSVFSVSPSSDVIPPSSSHSFYITFHPIVYGRRSSALLFPFGSAAREGSVLVTGDASSPFRVFVNDRWNMVSVPAQTSDLRKSIIYPDAASPAFSFIGTGYLQKDTLKYGLGYWVRFNSAGPIDVDGFADLSDTIPVQKNWNLFGAATHIAATGSLTAVTAHLTSQVYQYNAGYSVADSLRPGMAYWVRTDTSGKLIIHPAANVPGMGAKTAAVLQTNKLSSITVSDASGASQSLYVGTRADLAVPAAMFEMPPVPPVGLFDARFASNRSVEILSVGKQAEFPILLSSAFYPVAVSWKVNSADENLSLVVGGRETQLNSTGRIVLQNPALISVKVQDMKLLPSTFALHQNYPNPFNPSTIIRYDLPQSGKVTLKIFDILGREVSTLVDEVQEAGYRSAEWNAAGSSRTLSSGLYFYRLNVIPLKNTGATPVPFTDVKKLLLLK